MNPTPEEVQEPFDAVFKNVLRHVDDGFLTKEEVEKLCGEAGIEVERFYRWAAARRGAAAQSQGVSLI